MRRSPIRLKVGLALGVCLGALLPGVGAPSTGAARAESPPAATARDRDADITSKVSAQLQSTDELRRTDIHVVTDAGIVRLIGVVPSESARRVALEIARTTTGVAGVEDHLLVM